MSVTAKVIYQCARHFPSGSDLGYQQSMASSISYWSQVFETIKKEDIPLQDIKDECFELFQKEQQLWRFEE